MGNIEDVRKVVQDFVAPDLKALGVRLEALEKEMKERFVHADKLELERFAHAEKMNQERLAHVTDRFASVEKLIAAGQQTMMNTIAANQATIMNTLEMEKRLARLESERNKPDPPHA